MKFQELRGVSPYKAKKGGIGGQRARQVEGSEFHDPFTTIKGRKLEVFDQRDLLKPTSWNK